MKKIYLIFSVFLFSFVCYSQSGLYLGWDKEVGCEVLGEDREKGALFSEIEDGECLKVCENSEVNYSIHGIDMSSVNHIDWFVNGGSVSSNQNTAQVHWGASGAGGLKIEIFFNDGSQVVKNICIEIIKGPRALIGGFPGFGDPSSAADYVVICLEDQLDFTNLSDPNGGTAIVSSFWDFGDGGYSNQFEPSYIYSQPGNYVCSLTVKNSCGCTDTYKIEVKVTPQQYIGIDCNSVTCEGMIETYYPATDVNCSNIEWKVEGGTIVNQTGAPNFSVEVEWNDLEPEDGFGYVTMIPEDCDGCNMPSTIKVPIVRTAKTEELNLINGDSDICTSVQKIYKMPQWPSTYYKWSVVGVSSNSVQLVHTDQPNEIAVRFLGSFSANALLRCTYQNSVLGCGGIAEKRLKVSPTINILSDQQDDLCEGEHGYYYLPSGYSGSWLVKGSNNFQDTGYGNSISTTFDNPGTYTISVSSPDFCLGRPVRVNVEERPETPSGIVGELEVCPNNNYTYSLTEEVTDDKVLWEVSGGTINGTSEGNEISVTFDNSGSYSVMAWVEGYQKPYCRSEVIEINPQVFVMPLNISGANEVCPDSYESYSVSYTEATTYNWNIVPSTLGSIVQGQGTPSVEVEWYQSANSSPATLTVDATECGLSFSDSKIIDFGEVPEITLSTSASTICVGENLDISFSSNIPINSVDEIIWDFGDGNSQTITSGSNQITHAYTYISPTNNNINYNIKLTLKGINGCDNVQVIEYGSVTVLPKPIAHISPSIDRYFSSAANINVDFVATEESGLGGGSTIEWFDTSGSLSVFGSNFSPTDFGGYYAVITNNTTGCSDTTNTVWIRQTSGGSGCSTGPTDFDITIDNNDCGLVSATLHTNGSSYIDFDWHVGPGNTIINSNSSNTQIDVLIPFAGEYTFRADIHIQGVDSNGDPCVATKKVFGEAVPVPFIPDLRYTLSCGTQTGTYDVTLLDDSNYYAPNTISSWEYHLGSNSQMGNENGVTFSNIPAGQSINAYITISGSGGSTTCSSDLISVVIPDAPSVQINTSIIPSNICEEEATPFEIVSTNSNWTYEWHFGDLGVEEGTTSIANPDLSFSYGNSNFAEVIVTDEYGCSTSHSVNLNIIEMNMSGHILMPDPVCEGESVTLNFQADNGSTSPTYYHWMNEDDENWSNTTTNPSVTVSSPGSYWVVLEDQYTCKNYSTLAVSPIFYKPPSAHINGPVSICLSEQTYFTLRSSYTDEDATYKWYRNNSYIGSGIELSQNISSSGSYSFDLEITDADGVCTVSTSHVVEVFDSPNAPILDYDVVSCSPYIVEIKVTNPQNGNYTWSSGQSGTNIQVNHGGAFQVRFTDNVSGCSKASLIEIPENPEKYMWYFPSGCFDICYLQSIGSKTNSVPKILGLPYVDFGEWWYTLDYNGILGGSGLVDDLELHRDGRYDLTVTNPCTVTSDPMYLDYLDCPADLDKDMGDVIPTSYNGLCAYDIQVSLSSIYATSIDMFFSTLSNQGVIVKVTPNNGNNTIGVVAPGAPFNPTTTTFTVTVVPYAGVTYIDLKAIDVNNISSAIWYVDLSSIPCNNGTVQPLVPNTNDEEVAEDISSDSFGNRNRLVLAPNPASEYVNILFELSDQQKEYTIEIYNLLGNKLSTYKPRAVEGIRKESLSSFADGMYIVILKENDKIVDKQKLIIN